ncbi:MAG: bifunctional riboflavin kinase/FAD synthetase [Clostridiales bacterium]|nr:bifunctional riboflavin kinase/FAD synthetase [Clostridiales bacterium]
MNYVTGKTQFHMDVPSAVSLGKFDGLHRGHQRLIGHVLEQKKRGLQAVLFTFEKNPTRMLAGLSAQNIMTNAERRQRLENAGIDCLLECPFVPEIAHMEPERFVEEVLVRQLKTAFVAVGRDFRFGFQRRGDHALLRQMGETLGFQVEVVEKEQSHGRDISSTYIREALHEGNMPLVNELLGYRYSVSGEVLHGRRIGRTLGLPTTNLLPPAEKLLPPNGVYLTRTILEDGDYYGITNIGYKPTVGGETRRGVETFLFDFDRDLYGKEITVEILEYERPEQKFHSLDELKARILSDVYWGKSKIKVKEHL